MLAEVRALEQRLQQARQAVAKLKRENDPNTIFRDIKRPAALPVETLVANASSQVSALDLEDCALEIDPPCQFDRTLPLTIAGHVVNIHHAEHDKVWVDSLPLVEPGARIVQTRYLGSLPDLFEAFHCQWKRRWCKHDSIPNSQWQDIVDFAQHAFPVQQAPPLQLDISLLRAEVHRKKKTAAILVWMERAVPTSCMVVTISSLAFFPCMAEHRKMELGPVRSWQAQLPLLLRHHQQHR